MTEKPDKKTASASDSQKPDAALLEILVCPLTHAPLTYDAQKQELISEKAGLAFPIRDGIPIMLESEARKITTT